MIILFARLLAVLLLVSAAPAMAMTDQEIDAAVIRGPSTVSLRDQATLALPRWAMFLPEAQAKAILLEAGHHDNANVAGMILPAAPDGRWSVFVTFDRAGYVRDDDWKTIDPDRMLKDIRAANDAAAPRRLKEGHDAIQTVGWIENPAYDPAAHRLVWSLEVQRTDGTGQPTTKGTAVNYMIDTLGREGYLGFDLITGRQDVETYKPVVQQLAQAAPFNTGKRYEDFNPKTDKVAAFGVLALVGGGLVAKKLGLLAMAGVFALKFAKLIGVAAVAGTAGLRHYFHKKKT